MKPGKKFEEDFKNSIPNNYYWYRLKDQFMSNYDDDSKEAKAGNAKYDDSKRFTLKSDYDYQVFTGELLYCLELKSCQGKSLPFKNVKDHQINSLLEVSLKDSVVAGIVINYRDYEKTIFIDIDDYLDYLNESDRKSIPVDDAIEIGEIIRQQIRRTRYIYDLKYFFENNVIVFNGNYI